MHRDLTKTEIRDLQRHVLRQAFAVFSPEQTARLHLPLPYTAELVAGDHGLERQLKQLRQVREKQAGNG